MSYEEPAAPTPRSSGRFEKYSRRYRKWDERPPRRWEYIWAILWNIFFLYIVNKIPQWHWEFINGRYMVILWVLNASIAVHLGANLLMLILEFRWMRYVGKILMGIAAFITLIMLYYLYPFDFSQVPGWTWMDTFLPVFFIIGMAGSALSVIINCWKLIFRWDR